MLKGAYLLTMLVFSLFFFSSCDGKSVQVRFESKGKEEHYLIVSDTHNQTMSEIEIVDLDIANQKGKRDESVAWLVVFIRPEAPMKEVIRYGDNMGGKVLVPAKPLIKGHKYYFIIRPSSSAYSFQGNFVYGEPSE